jgi:hypothetical protein
VAVLESFISYHFWKYVASVFAAINFPSSKPSPHSASGKSSRRKPDYAPFSSVEVNAFLPVPTIALQAKNLLWGGYWRTTGNSCLHPKILNPLGPPFLTVPNGIIRSVHGKAQSHIRLLAHMRIRLRDVLSSPIKVSLPASWSLEQYRLRNNIFIAGLGSRFFLLGCLFQGGEFSGQGQGVPDQGECAKGRYNGREWQLPGPVYDPLACAYQECFGLLSMRWGMMGMRRGMFGCGGVDAMMMVGVMVILASNYPRRLVVRDEGEGGCGGGDSFWGEIL